jgi:hypothetical protein
MGLRALMGLRPLYSVFITYGNGFISCWDLQIIAFSYLLCLTFFASLYPKGTVSPD